MMQEARGVAIQCRGAECETQNSPASHFEFAAPDFCTVSSCIPCWFATTRAPCSCPTLQKNLQSTFIRLLKMPQVDEIMASFFGSQAEMYHIMSVSIDEFLTRSAANLRQLESARSSAGTRVLCDEEIQNVKIAIQLATSQLAEFKPIMETIDALFVGRS